MKFKLKAFAAGCILLASANAQAITTQNGGELFLVAWDSVGTNTFVATLGLGTVTDFVTNNTASANVSFTDANGASAAWTSFTTAAGANLNSVKYSVIGIDKLSTQVLSTAVSGSANATSNQQFGNLMNATTGTGATRTFTNTTYAALSGEEEGAFLANSTGTGSANIPGTRVFGFLTNINSQQTISTVGTPTTSAFYLFNDNDNGNPAFVTSTLLGNWTLTTAGQLSYASVAAVPEADTSAMMLAGLGLMGFVARRRNKSSN